MRNPPPHLGGYQEEIHNLKESRLLTAAATTADPPAQRRLDWIVMKCWRRTAIVVTKRQRAGHGYPAASAERAGHGRSTEQSYALKKFVVRHKWPIIANAIIVLLILAGLIGTSLGLRRATAARIQADENAARASNLAAAAKPRKQPHGSRRRPRVLRKPMPAPGLLGQHAERVGRVRRRADRLRRHYLEKVPTGLRGWNGDIFPAGWI